jgi:triphosphoribosyl-dephospho-CoA synthase
MHDGRDVPFASRRVGRVSAAFLRACALDVEVRKPGNVSSASPGHGMQASQFIASAEAAAGPLCRPGASVGERIEAAVAASWSAVGCNTNLGIVLLCAPIAAAAEHCAGPLDLASLRNALNGVLERLDLDDASAAYRAIAHANPGGLGSAPTEDVRRPPSIGLRAAMALAADRDLIARQYRDGFNDLFELALPLWPKGLSIDAPIAELNRAVQRVYLTLLAAFPDSHIVRKHGEGVAHNVMTAAQRFHAGAAPTEAALAAFDDTLKSQRINPGTTADLTVATLMLQGLLGAPAAPHESRERPWHGT